MKPSPGEELISHLESVVNDFSKSGVDLIKRDFMQLDDLPGYLVKGITEHFIGAWGGQQLYVPKGVGIRNAKIVAEFTGDNHEDLARRHGITVRTVYDILAIDRAWRQPRLPFDDD